MKFTFLLITLILFSFANAAIITVDNRTPSIGDYTDLNAAVNAASAGDIIYVFPSPVSYSLSSITKQVHIIGTGFSQPEETVKQTFLNGNVTITSEASGTVLEGFQFSSNLNFHIDGDNITIKKNKLNYITINANIQGTIIIQNYFYVHYSNTWAMEIGASCEIFISNNIFDNQIGPGGIMSQNLSITKILHNVFYNIDVNAYSLLAQVGSYIANNIFINGQIATYSSLDVYNNMCNGTQLPVGSGNLLNVDMNTVFEDYLNGDYHLKSGSPANGAGQNGVDMGIYGGAIPFVDGGFPGLPSVTNLQAPHVVTQNNGLDVIIDAKSNKP